MVIYGLLHNDLKGENRNLADVMEEENNRNVVVVRGGRRKYRNVVVEKENNRNVMVVMEEENNRNVVVVKEGRTRSKPIYICATFYLFLGLHSAPGMRS